MNELIEAPPPAAAQQQTPEQQAFGLTYAFHEKAKSTLKQDAIVNIAAIAGTIGAAVFLPSFATLAVTAFVGYIAWDIYNGRRKNLILCDVFNEATKDFGEKLKDDLRPLEEAVNQVVPFGLKDIEALKNHFVGTQTKAIISLAIGFGIVTGFLPLVLAPVYAAGGIEATEKMTTMNIRKAAMEAGENLKNRHPDLEL